MAFEISEAMNKSGALADWASKVVYKNELTQDETEFSEYVDQWARAIGKTGHDANHELSALVERALGVDEITAPSELISALFNEGSIGEFDDTQIVQDPKNTIQVHDAIIEGNVDRSFVEHKVFKPTWRTLAAETDISMQDLRRGGYRTVANYVQMIRDALEIKRVQALLAAADAAVVSGNDNYITEATTLPTVASADALALYLHDMTNGAAPVSFMLNKYRQAMSKLPLANTYASDAMKGLYNADGFLREYAGVSMMGYSGQKKLPDGSLVLPDKRIFGFADKIGTALTRGETRVLQSEDINAERVHVKVTGYTFGYAITNPEYIAKIVLA